VPAYDLVCRDCGATFAVSLKTAIKSKQKRCPECRSQAIRQTFASYLRNGSLATQGCAPRNSGFG
jgi:putative FmdB family regulatory protein